MKAPRAIFKLDEVDRGWDQIRKSVRALKDGDSYVKVGVMGSSGPAPAAGEMDTVSLATLHELGSQDGTIPERSWIRSTFEMNRPVYVGLLRNLLRQVYEGKMSMQKVLGVLGMKMAADIKNRVTRGTGIPPPNAPATFERKLRKGYANLRGKKRKFEGPVMSPRTLVDTGRMVGSVTWAVVLSGDGKEGGGSGTP